MKGILKTIQTKDVYTQTANIPGGNREEEIERS